VGHCGRSQGVQPPACPVGAGQHLTSNAGAPLGATFECLRTVCRGSGLLRREAPCGNVLDLAITRLAEGCFHGVWGGGRLAGLRSGLQPPIGWGTVRRFCTAPTHQQNNLPAKPPRPNGPGNGRSIRAGPRRGSTLAGCLLALQGSLATSAGKPRRSRPESTQQRPRTTEPRSQIRRGAQGRTRSCLSWSCRSPISVSCHSYHFLPRSIECGTLHEGDDAVI
jgi:hypothetical protein